MTPSRATVRVTGATRRDTSVSAHARADRADRADKEQPREDPDGVVGIPTGGDRRVGPARPPPVDRAGRRRARRRRAGPTAFGYRPEHPPLSDEISEGVRVVAAAQDPHEFSFGDDMMAWTLAMGHSMVRAGLSLKTDGGQTSWRPDLVHAHDWLVAHPAIALAEFYDVPLVSTIHATEAGRHSGWVSGRLSRQVHAVESWLVRESDSLITCSASMRDEIADLFGPGLAETTVIPNGIDAARWPFARRRPRTGPPELLFVGRLEYEGRTRRHRGTAADPAGTPGHDADCRRRRHPTGLADRVRPKTPGAQSNPLRGAAGP